MKLSELKKKEVDGIMSEKRFELRGLGVFDTENDNKSLSRVDVVELLNNLTEENEQLKQELNNFKPVMFQDIRKGTVILYSKEG